jgi:hypothetical protein
MTPELDQFAPEESVPFDPEIQAQIEEEEKASREEFLRSLSSFTKTYIKEDIEPEKVQQYSEIRRNILYWKGQQFLRRIVRDDAIVDFEPVQNKTSGERAENLFDYYINDIRGYGRKFIGVVAQQPPNIKAVPNKKGDEDHIRRSKTADRVGDELYGMWNMRDAIRNAASIMWVAGRVYFYTPFVADQQKYGVIEEPIYEDQEVELEPGKMRCLQCANEFPADQPSPAPCPQCGAMMGPESFTPPKKEMFPTQTGTEKYPAGCAELRVYSGLHVTTPFSVVRLDKTPWLLLEMEEHWGTILNDYRSNEEVYTRLRGMFPGDTQEGIVGGEQGRVVRDLATSVGPYQAPPRKNRASLAQLWLKPPQYEMADEELRERLHSEFPEGVRITLVNGEAIELTPENLLDVWKMTDPEPSDLVLAEPLCNDMISAQDLLNATHNICAETLERMIPQTFIDVDKIDLQARKKNQLPASHIPVRMTVGRSIGDSITNVPVAKFEPELVGYPQQVREHTAETVGITREIYGAGEKQQTAYATNLKRNQAMLQLSPQIEALRDLAAGATENGIKQMARYSGGRIPSRFNPMGEAEHLDLEELIDGGWHIEAEDAAPMSWSEIRVTLMELLEKGPDVMQLLGFFDHENVRPLRENLVGIKGWKLPRGDAYDKVRETIIRLLRGRPTPQLDQASGETILIPSEPVDDFEDDPQFAADVVRAWSQEEEVRRNPGGIRKENPEGYANVVAWGKAHAGLAMQQMIRQQESQMQQQTQGKTPQGAPPKQGDSGPAAGQPPPGVPTGEAPPREPPVPPL